MKSLYESILSSTKSGKSITITKIEEWWRKYYEDKGDFSVEFIDGKFFVIMDDFSAQPRQGSVQIGPGPFISMPSDLAGIYYYRYENKTKKELDIPKITFSNLNGVKVDLGSWDMSKSEKNPDIIAVQIQFFNCNSIKLVGLPKFKNVFNVYFEFGKDNKIQDVKSPMCNLSIYEEGSDIRDVKNSVLRSFIVSYRNFIDTEIIIPPHYLSTRGVYIGKEWTTYIDNLLDSNNIEILRYMPDKDYFVDRKIKNKNLKIIPYKNTNRPSIKYKMIEL